MRKKKAGNTADRTDRADGTNTADNDATPVGTEPVRVRVLLNVRHDGVDHAAGEVCEAGVFGASLAGLIERGVVGIEA